MKKQKIIDVTEITALYAAFNLMSINIELNKGSYIKNGLIIFKDPSLFDKKTLKMAINDAEKIRRVLSMHKDYVELADKRFMRLHKAFTDFGEHYGIVTAYSLLYQYAEDKKFNLFKFHKNRAQKFITYFRKEAVCDGEEIKYTDKVFLNSVRFGELLFKKIKGEI